MYPVVKCFSLSRMNGFFCSIYCPRDLAHEKKTYIGYIAMIGVLNGVSRKQRAASITQLVCSNQLTMMLNFQCFVVTVMMYKDVC